MAGTVVADLFAKLGLLPDVKSWAKGDKLISGIKAGLAGIATTFAASKIVGMITGVANLGGELSDTSQMVGITAEALQELRYGAGLAGVEAEALTGGLTKFAKGMNEAQKTGKGPFAEALAKLRVRMRDLKGETLDQNLEVIADRFAAMPNGAKKTALAMDLFGKSGAKLIPFLNEGSGGIVKLRNEARELGVVLDNETVGGLDNFGDDMDRVKATLTGLRNQAVAAILPMLQKLVTGLLEWVKANREIIRSTIAGAMQAVVAVMRVLGKVLEYVVKVIGFFVENAELGKSVLIALGIVIGAFAIKAAAAWIIAFAPVALAVAAIAAIVLGVRMLAKHWDKIGDRMWKSTKAFGNRIKKFFTKDIPDAVKSGFAAAFAFIANLPVVASLLALVAGIKGLLDFGEKFDTSAEIESAKAAERFTQRLSTPEGQESQRRRDEARRRLTEGVPAPVIPTAPAPRVPEVRIGTPSASNGPISFAPTITVTGSSDPEVTASLIDKKLREALDDMLTQAEESIA